MTMAERGKRRARDDEAGMETRETNQSSCLEHDIRTVWDYMEDQRLMPHARSGFAGFRWARLGYGVVYEKMRCKIPTPVSL